MRPLVSFIVLITSACATKPSNPDSSASVDTMPPTDGMDTVSSDGADSRAPAATSESGPTDPTSSSADSEIATGTSSTSTAVTGTAASVYSGTIRVAIEDIGIVVNPDSCTAPVDFHVDASASPQVTATTTCVMTGILAGQDLVLRFQGSLSGSSVSGQVDLDWNTTFNPTDSWNGTLDDATLKVDTFQGAENQGSAGFTWDVAEFENTLATTR